MSDLIRKSKFLSLVLRHKPDLIGIKLDRAGWVSVEELLKGCKRHGHFITSNELESIVTNNNKKRYEYSEDGVMIRASQGHSVDVELGYKKSIPPDFLYHGTASNNVDSIMKKGINKGSRHHVHLSLDIETARNVGQRHGNPVVLTIRSGDMSKEGMSFYLSANGVWLTEHVNPEFIKPVYKETI